MNYIPVSAVQDLVDLNLFMGSLNRLRHDSESL
jgi:hypothetical protein